MNNNEQWSVYDTNVQSYRSNFISSQSLLLTVGAIFVNESVWLEGCVAIIALIQMWLIWFRVINSRTIISDFYKFNAKYDFSNKINQSGEIEQNPIKPMTEETYVKFKNRKIRKKANANLAYLTGIDKLKSNLRITRIKLDIILPITFTIIWGMMFLYCIFG